MPVPTVPTAPINGWNYQPAPAAPEWPIEGFSGVRTKDGRSYGRKIGQEPNVRAAHLSWYKPDNAHPGQKPQNIWGDFSQWNNDNCSIVAVIKIAMMQFGEKPTDVFKEVRETPDGYQVTLRNGETTSITKAELKEAAEAAKLKCENPMTGMYANFMVAVAAKRFQEESHQAGPGDFTRALGILNSGGSLEYAFRRLGLWDQVEQVPPEELVDGRMGVFQSDTHSAIAVDGHEERWGKQGGVPPTDSTVYAAYAFKAAPDSERRKGA